MRINSASNQFLFQFPTDFIAKEVDERLKRFMEKNWIPYLDPLSYINSTIKEIVFPAISYEGSEQIHKFGKKIEYKPATNIYDTYTNTLDITLRSVDSHSNYFMAQQIFAEYYNNTRKYYLPWLNLVILDKDGDYLYSAVFRAALLKSLSEVRLQYQSMDVAEQTFTITFKYNFMDVYWDLSDNPEMKKDNIFYSQTWSHDDDILPRKRPQNDYDSLDDDTSVSKNGGILPVDESMNYEKWKEIQNKSRN
jgi:hypothetical protein